MPIGDFPATKVEIGLTRNGRLVVNAVLKTQADADRLIARIEVMADLMPDGREPGEPGEPGEAEAEGSPQPAEHHHATS